MEIFGLTIDPSGIPAGLQSPCIRSFGFRISWSGLCLRMCFT